MSQRAYARYRGVTLGAVQKALKSGRVHLVDGLVDSEMADREWKRNTEPLQQQRGVTGGADPKPYAQTVRSPMNEGGTGSLAQTQAVHMGYKARMAKLQYEERLGKLVPVEEVRRVYFAAARNVRDGLMTIPGRLSGVLVGRTDQTEIELLIEKEIRETCSALDQQPRLREDGPGAVG